MDGFHELIKAQVAAAQPSVAGAAEGGTADDPAAVYVAPSQAEFAAKVAKDIARDLVPRPVLVGGLILLALVILFFLLR